MGLRVRTALVPVLGAVLAGYATVLAVYAAQPPVPLFRLISAGKIQRGAACPREGTHDLQMQEKCS